jgi:hypothetical protein
MIKDVEVGGTLMAMVSTMESLSLMIMNKARGIIKPNETIHVSKLTK